MTRPTAPDAAAPGVLARALCLAHISLAFGRVERVTRHEDGRRPETDTDHSIMLGLVACELAPAHLDRAKVAAFALVHDLAEVYAGDTQTLTITAEGMAAKHDREAVAQARLVAELGAGSWVAETLATYERQREPEARFVRLIDKVLPKLTHAFNGCAAAVALTDRAGFVEAHARQLEKLRAEYPELPEAHELLRASMLHSEACWPTSTADLARLRAPADLAAIEARAVAAREAVRLRRTCGECGAVDPATRVIGGREFHAECPRAPSNSQYPVGITQSTLSPDEANALADDIGALLALLAAEREGHAAEVAGARAAALREAEAALRGVMARQTSAAADITVRSCLRAIAALAAKGGGA